MYAIIFTNARGDEQTIFTYNGAEAVMTAQYLRRAGFDTELITPSHNN